jgi:hypothetical protein
VHKRLERRLKLQPRQLARHTRVLVHDLGQGGADLGRLDDEAVGLELLAAVIALLVAHDDGELGRLLVLGGLLDIVRVLVDPGPVAVVVGRALVDVLGLADGPDDDLGLVLLLGAVLAVLLFFFVFFLLFVLFVFLLLLLLLLVAVVGLGLGVGVEGGSRGALRQLPRLGGAARFLLGAGAQ